MSAFGVRRLEGNELKKWDEFVETGNGGTIFHRLDFLAYHRDRFHKNEHHIAIYKGDAVYGLMPMAVFEQKGKRVAKSPYGGSCGGPVFQRPPTYADSHEVVEAILQHLAFHGVKELSVTMPVSACYRQYSETFALVLLERGCQCVNRDVSSLVYLDQGVPVFEGMKSRARNAVRKAQKSGVHITRGAPIEDFWPVLEKNCRELGIRPTHSFSEFKWLHEHLPERVYADVAYVEGRCAGGIAYFVINQRVNSSFYLCQDSDHREKQVLSLLIYEALATAQSEGFSWFDFGTSSMKMQGNANLFLFKEGFGAVGLFRDTYMWKAG